MLPGERVTMTLRICSRLKEKKSGRGGERSIRTFGQIDTCVMLGIFSPAYAAAAANLHVPANGAAGNRKFQCFQPVNGGPRALSSWRPPSSLTEKRPALRVHVRGVECMGREVPPLPTNEDRRQGLAKWIGTIVTTRTVTGAAPPRSISTGNRIAPLTTKRGKRIPKENKNQSLK